VIKRGHHNKVTTQNQKPILSHKRGHERVGEISNLPKDLIHENSEQNMAESMEIRQIMFTRNRYEQNMSSISKSIASPRN
jgi:hypothetical protein